MKVIIIITILLLFFCSIASAQNLEDRVKILEETLKKQEQMIQDQQKLIEELKAEMKASKPLGQLAVAQPKETPSRLEQELLKTSALDKVKEVLLPKEGEPKRDILSYQVGGATLRLVDVSFDALMLHELPQLETNHWGLFKGVVMIHENGVSLSRM